VNTSIEDEREERRKFNYEKDKGKNQMRYRKYETIDSQGEIEEEMYWKLSELG
jgi:hypothetical protein